MAGTAIRTTGLSRDFSTVKAVQNLTIDVPAGTVFGFLGPNGSGKTTTIRLLLGLLEPTAGSIEVLGFNPSKSPDPIRQRCGALLEHSGIYERLTAEENLELFGRIWNLSSSERKARIQELLESFGLWDRRKERAGTWSRGMKQKLAVARAMLHRPALIFLDEPTAGLDAVAAASLRDELAGLTAREGVTVFLTTHNMAEAEKLCANVAVIRQGKLLASGTPGELRAHGGGPRAEVVARGLNEQVLALVQAHPSIRSATLQNGHLILEFDGEPDVSPLIPIMVGAGVQIDEIRKGAESLEDVFLALVKEGEA